MSAYLFSEASNAWVSVAIVAAASLCTLVFVCYPVKRYLDRNRELVMGVVDSVLSDYQQACALLEELAALPSTPPEFVQRIRETVTTRYRQYRSELGLAK